MGKYNCKKCDIDFEHIEQLDRHFKINCVSLVEYNNIYTFDEETLGCNKYPDDKAGNIYIVQNDSGFTNHYKVGISITINNRLSSYRCGATIEPNKKNL